MHGKRFMLPVGAALVLAASTAAPAFAGGAVTSGTVYTYSSQQLFNYTTSVPYWSVFAEQPLAPADYLGFYNGKFGLLGTSQDAAGETNFVAVDSNAGTQPYQLYYGFVPDSPAGQYSVEVQDGANTVSIPTPTHQGTTGFSDPDLAFMTVMNNQIVTIRDIYLTAGQSFWASGQGTAEQNLLLLEANPSNSSSFIQTRAAATEDQNTQVIDDCTLYTAEVTGWHALVIVSNSTPNGNGQEGIGIALHAFDATDPAGYCPIADFPAATPAP
jgi:hypothetical protein